jgi:Flp pilus assembly pilin Flp
MTKFTKFLSDDAGAVTIDWVALTAGILLLGILVVYSIFNNGVSGLVSKINSTLQGVSINVPSSSITF